jgi:CubicO group peptidase (beta-lactamase class C family)
MNGKLVLGNQVYVLASALLIFSVVEWEGLSAPSNSFASSLEQELGSLVPKWLGRWQVPGVAVAVVKDGSIWTQGYGFAELAPKKPVDPSTTTFRVASLSKLLTATAALQLVDKGKLELHADIEPYLKGTELSRGFEEAITLHHLLTHTGGFDRSDVGDATPHADQVYGLQNLVEDHSTPQTLRPGLAYHYSNFGFALIGHLVERASEQPFSAYIEQQVLRPLGMKNTSFYQPPPQRISLNLAQPFYWTGTDYQALPLDYSQVGPADALISTAEDMALFIRAHLEGGVLESATLEAMHAQQYTASPGPYGTAYAFQENFRSGRRILEHSGAQLGFSSYLLLLPEERLGLFIAQNRREGNLRWAMVRTIFDNLLDQETYSHASSLERDPVFSSDNSLYTGRYRHTGYPHHTFEKAAYILGFRGGEALVESAGQGVVSINGQRFVASGPHMFTHPEHQHWVKGFVLDEEGKVSHHVSGREVLERTPWWERKRVIQLSLIASVLLGIWCFSVWPLSRRVCRQAQETRDEITGRRIVMAISALWCISLVAFVVTMPFMMDGPVQFDYGPSWALIALLTLLLLACAGALAFPVVVCRAWHQRWWGIPVRFCLTLQSVLLLVGVGALHYMNLLGYQF